VVLLGERASLSLPSDPMLGTLVYTTRHIGLRIHWTYNPRRYGRYRVISDLFVGQKLTESGDARASLQPAREPLSCARLIDDSLAALSFSEFSGPFKCYQR
jgi:hypothetical protein